MRAPRLICLCVIINLICRMQAAEPAAVAPPVEPGSTLKLADAMRWVLEKNFALRVQEQDVLIARDGTDRARGDFDPRVFVSGTYEDNVRKLNAIDYSSFGLGSGNPQSTLFTEQNFRSAAGISGKLPTGTQYELSVTANQLENDVNRAGRFYFPEFESFMGLTLSQPLLKDFWLKPNMADTYIARYEVRIAERTREVEVINKLIEVTNAYYDLVFGLENLKVKHEAVGVAQKLREENAERVRLGKMTDIDVTQADVRISEAREEEFLGEDFLRERRVRLLKLLVSQFPAGAIPDFAVVADLDVPALTAAPADLYAVALEHRPDLVVAQEQVGRNRVGADRAHNQRLPQVDLRFTYGRGGLADEFSSSFSQIYDENQRRISGGVVASLPIGNHKASADARTARRRVQQAELTVEELKTSISLEVSNAYQRLQTLRLRLETASQSRAYAEQSLGVEQARLDAGKTTSFVVLDFQQKVSDARTREIAARVDLKKAEAELWGATGTFLPKHGFTTADTVVVSQGNGKPATTTATSVPASQP